MSYRSRSYRQAGLTLLELLITIAIIGLIGGLTVASGIFGGSRLKEQTLEIMGALRGTQQMAIETGNHHRLLLTLGDESGDEQGYIIERCANRPRLRKEAVDALSEELKEQVEAREKADGSLLGRAANYDTTVPKEVIEAISLERATEVAGLLSNKRVGTAVCQPIGVTVTGGVPQDAKPKVFDSDIKVKRLFIQHLEDPTDAGMVAINFFPGGRTEKLIIETTDGEDTFSVLMHGLTGRLELRAGELDDPDEHMMRNPLGDREAER